MTTWPPPVVPVFNAGYGYLANDFNSLWMDPAGFFQNRVVFRANQSSAATTLPSSGSPTTIAYDTILEDPYSGWFGSPDYLWEAPSGYSGWYQVTITLRTANPGALVDLQPCIRGTYSYNLNIIQGASGQTAGASATFPLYLIGGQDTVSVAGRVLNSSSNINTSTTSGQNSTLEITWVGQI